MKKKSKIGFISLGCPKNQVDTEVMLADVVKAGYEVTPDDTEADIVIINTCAFIESAKQEAIDNILDEAWLKKNANLKGIIVTGCLAQRYREQVFEELPEVDALIGVGSLHKIVDAIEAVERKRQYASFEDIREMETACDRVVTTPEYLAYLKISEGCDNRCTYCAIPDIRGKFRSRKIEDVVAEAKELESLGVKELNLIAQDTSRYGLDLYGDYKLAELVRAITENTEIPWIRLLYCYPDKITDELIRELAENPRLVKYMDIPVQHISDPILAAMNRHGDSALIRKTVAKLRAAVPDITLRTTAIVGFPGEGEEDFEKLCLFIKEAEFDRFGAFTYSAEENTPAAELDGQIDEDVKKERYDTLMEIQVEISAKKNEAKIGKEITVLCEGYDPVAESYYGRSAADAPDIDGKVWFTSAKRLQAGSFVQVKIKEAMDYDLVGVVI